MGYAELQGSLFSDFQELRLQAAKLADMSSGILQEGRFADALEKRFQAANPSNMGNADLQRGAFN